MIGATPPDTYGLSGGVDVYVEASPPYPRDLARRRGPEKAGSHDTAT
ncbi:MULTISPECIES: hypothetical protein [Rhodococcus]|nr:MULTISPECIES: hypothetical protein [Rhodococcus]QSE81602.1 hypothetical protein JWS14_21820 [Rhodococcus koreensis]